LKHKLAEKENQLKQLHEKPVAPVQNVQLEMWTQTAVCQTKSKSVQTIAVAHFLEESHREDSFRVGPNRNVDEQSDPIDSARRISSVQLPDESFESHQPLSASFMYAS